MNMAAYRGVYLWEVAREGAGMTMKAAGNSLELLQRVPKKPGCALEVLSYGGLPFFWGDLAGGRSGRQGFCALRQGCIFCPRLSG